MRAQEGREMKYGEIIDKIAELEARKQTPATAMMLMMLHTELLRRKAEWAEMMHEKFCA